VVSNDREHMRAAPSEAEGAQTEPCRRIAEAANDFLLH
jgi:hypothetical protein